MQHLMTVVVGPGALMLLIQTVECYTIYFGFATKSSYQGSVVKIILGKIKLESSMQLSS